jgi:hypothetical protein
MSQNLHELKIHIQDTCKLGDMQMLSIIWNETEYCLDA